MIYPLLRPILFLINADKAHHSTITFAKFANAHPVLRNAARTFYHYESPLLAQNIWNLNFPNPVGLAAGFDKNGMAPAILSDIGFGFLEIGSVTARPSTGNPLPRAFRIPDDHSLINRMGLNNDGIEIVTSRLQSDTISVPLGINIAKTNDPEILGDSAIEDYLTSYAKAADVAGYITLNISCPNTSEGKTFEDTAALSRLLTAIFNIRRTADPPLLVKFSVDLDRNNLQHLVEICETNGIDGYVACNTSISRAGLKTSPEVLAHIGYGGLSGRAIAGRSNKIIGWIYEITGGKKPIIGAGGIDSVEAALQKFRAGADLIQIYTGLIYEGPGLVKKINRGLAEYLSAHGMSRLSEIRQV